MNKLMIRTIQKMAIPAFVIGFFLTVLPRIGIAQMSFEIADNVRMNHVESIYRVDYIKSGQSANVVNHIKFSLSPDPVGHMWVNKLSDENNRLERFTEVRRDAEAIYLVNYLIPPNRSANYGDDITLKIDVSNKKIYRISDGVITSELGSFKTMWGHREETSGEENLIYQQEEAANRAYTLTNPLKEQDLNAVMQWIGKETSRFSVDFCWKDTYTRETYNNQQECESKENGECIQLGLLWYVKCKAGYETSTPPFCLMKCPNTAQVLAGAQHVKFDCGLLCATFRDQCASGVSDMVFAPINMALNILTFGLNSTASNALKSAALGGAAAASQGVTKTALSTNWIVLLNAIQKADDAISPILDAKDQLEYLFNTVDDLKTEFDRWNSSFEQNFSDYTHYKIESIIDQKFPDPDDRKYIKRAYGQYYLTAMLEADGWRIGKAILAAASIEPLGVVATVNAFAHPVCQLTPTPFPTVTIIPKNQRYKLYPIVKFHRQNSMTLDQAKRYAKSKSWTLATAAEVSNAFTVHNLDVYAYGMLSSGKFAVPVQSDHHNFKKGRNINATGGNQGFFYTEGLHNTVLPPSAPIVAPPVTTPAPAVMAPASPGFVRFQNRWYNKNYLHNQNGKIEVGPIKSGWWSSQWKIVPVGNGWVRIQNKWKPNHYLHNQNGKLEQGPIQDNWWSSQWKIVPPTGGWARIQNKWKPDQFLHNQNGKIEVGPIHNAWHSALWMVK